ncbi:response regulator transcription factor [Coxiella burnetii]|uniref:Bacterial regulatory protein, luxR family n=1 Tax=Coxiella burnetii (strain RSA 493 / Nine Mile phase I) TaxID=227377 RepID=Q83AD2_COXBU|nr:LuxR C-terminal-related transcriptional regulator [Coxiella burnetii]NP_820947.1 LuxR family transcriptional regulator [Coxiella burnetii RSA 493]AAO91461.1 bacterial regulatory protein, luxR family [Coxiella burnetii RSA 493]AML48002.1 LuxR family transcriptional regulator [Coxiella burnetii]AML54028.1 LuxR family transcriptional regulator [Coxiella burnetii]ARI66720.1 LuxR family transcriptional regulator [Coxiella burnetii]ARK28154.1 LuxR family transcriptional regulator [Coxiella burne
MIHTPGVYLTPRELEISLLLLRRQRYKAIAERLCLSSRSVEYYVQNIKLKFYCRNKKTLIAELEKLHLNLGKT